MPKDKHIIEVKTTGAKKSQKQIKGVSGALGGLAKQAGAAAAAYFGTQALLQGIRSSIDAFAKQELAEKKLEAALGKTSQALLNQAAAIQKVTMFGDEQVIEAQALIGSFVREEEAIMAATQATLDLAAAKGMELTVAADLVSKTLGSSTNALSRYGIEVTGAVGSTERLESLTGNLARVFGGQATEQAKTLTGAMAQLGNSFGDLQETLASEFANQIVTSSKSVTNWIDSITTSLKINQLTTFMATDAYKELGKEAQASHIMQKIGLLETQVLLEEDAGLVKKLMDNYGGWTQKVAELALPTQVQNLLKLGEALGINVDMSSLVSGGFDALNESIPVNTEEIDKLKTQIALLNEEYLKLNENTENENENNETKLTTQEEFNAKKLAEYEKLVLTNEEKEQELSENFIKNNKEKAKLLGLESKADKDASKAKEDRMKVIQKLGTVSKAVASAEKSFAIKSTLQDTYAAAQAQFKKFSQTYPAPLGQILGAAAAGAAISSGLANVASIKQAQYGADFVTSGPELMMVGEGSGPERVQVTPLVDENIDGPQGGGMTINVQGSVIGTEEFVESVLLDQIKEGLRLGGDIGI